MFYDTPYAYGIGNSHTAAAPVFDDVHDGLDDTWGAGNTDMVAAGGGWGTAADSSAMTGRVS